MIKISGTCKCGCTRNIECDDPGALQKIKEIPCHICGEKINYKSDNTE